MKTEPAAKLILNSETGKISNGYINLLLSKRSFINGAEYGIIKGNRDFVQGDDVCEPNAA